MEGIVSTILPAASSFDSQGSAFAVLLCICHGNPVLRHPSSTVNKYPSPFCSLSLHPSVQLPLVCSCPIFLFLASLPAPLSPPETGLACLSLSTLSIACFSLYDFCWLFAAPVAPCSTLRCPSLSALAHTCLPVISNIPFCLSLIFPTLFPSASLPCFVLPTLSLGLHVSVPIFSLVFCLLLTQEKKTYSCFC